MTRFPVNEFNITKRNNPYWSDFSIFMYTVRKFSGMSRNVIRSNFLKLIDKDDYAQEDKKELFEWVFSEYKKTSA